MNKKANEFIIPLHPTPHQIEGMLAVCSNQIAILADKLTRYKSDTAIKDTVYKRALARAIIAARGSGVPASIVSKTVEVDDAVIKAKDDLDVASAVYELARGEFEGWNSHFVALRKIAEIRKTEMYTTG